MDLLNLKASQTRQILRDIAERNLLESQGKNRNNSYVMSTEKTIKKLLQASANLQVLLP